MVAYKRLVVNSICLQGMVQSEPHFLERQASGLLKVADKPFLLLAFLDLDLEGPDHPYSVLLDGRNYHPASLWEREIQVVHHVLYFSVRPGFVLELEGESHPLPVHVGLEITIWSSPTVIPAI